MKQWHAGDIITTAKWTSLNTRYPIARKINYYNNTNYIFDIQYDELMDLINHDVICWTYDENNCVRFLNNEENFDHYGERAGLPQYE